MSNKGKLAIVLLVILLVFSLALAGGGLYLFQKERLRNLAIQEEFDNLKIKYNQSEANLGESRRVISAMESKLEEAKKQIIALNSDLQQERTQRLEALSRIEQLKIDLDKYKELRADLENRLNQAQDKIKEVGVELRRVQAEKKYLEAKIKGTISETEDVELGEIVVTPEAPLVIEETAEKKTPKVSVSRREGKILVINKEYNFVVINLGNQDGVEIGDLFSVYHNDEYIGDVEVEKIHDAMSAAGFVSPDIKNKVSEGDRVVQKNQ